MPLIFKQSLDLLVAIGWLEPAGETTKTRRYRLSASARGDRRFEDLVARVKGSAN